jgi:hypothetical protein
MDRVSAISKYLCSPITDYDEQAAHAKLALPATRARHRYILALRRRGTLVGLLIRGR